MDLDAEAAPPLSPPPPPPPPLPPHPDPLEAAAEEAAEAAAAAAAAASDDDVAAHVPPHLSHADSVSSSHDDGSQSHGGSVPHTPVSSSAASSPTGSAADPSSPVTNADLGLEDSSDDDEAADAAAEESNEDRDGDGDASSPNGGAASADAATIDRSSSPDGAGAAADAAASSPIIDISGGVDAMDIDTGNENEDGGNVGVATARGGNAGADKDDSATKGRGERTDDNGDVDMHEEGSDVDAAAGAKATDAHGNGNDASEKAHLDSDRDREGELDEGDQQEMEDEDGGHGELGEDEEDVGVGAEEGEDGVAAEEGEDGVAAADDGHGELEEDTAAAPGEQEQEDPDPERGIYEEVVSEVGPCSICGQSKYVPGSNEMMRCGKCDVVVHTWCYGLTSADDMADWYCKPCDAWMSGESPHGADAKCQLCELRESDFAVDPDTGRSPFSHALTDYVAPPKKRKSGKKAKKKKRWAHVLCAQFLGCDFEDINTWSGVKPHKGSKSSKKGGGDGHPCSVCHETRGAKLECQDAGCGVRFHPTCGFSRGYFMQALYEPRRGTGANAALSSFARSKYAAGAAASTGYGYDDVIPAKYVHYCPAHRPDRTRLDFDGLPTKAAEAEDEGEDEEEEEEDEEVVDERTEDEVEDEEEVVRAPAPREKKIDARTVKAKRAKKLRADPDSDENHAAANGAAAGGGAATSSSKPKAKAKAKPKPSAPRRRGESSSYGTMDGEGGLPPIAIDKKDSKNAVVQKLCVGLRFFGRYGDKFITQGLSGKRARKLTEHQILGSITNNRKHARLILKKLRTWDDYADGMDADAVVERLSQELKFFGLYRDSFIQSVSGRNFFNLTDTILKTRFKMHNSVHRAKILELISAPAPEQQEKNDMIKLLRASPPACYAEFQEAIESFIMSGEGGHRELVSDEVLADQLFIPKARDRQEVLKKAEKALRTIDAKSEKQRAILAAAEEDDDEDDDDEDDDEDMEYGAASSSSAKRRPAKTPGSSGGSSSSLTNSSGGGKRRTSKKKQPLPAAASRKRVAVVAADEDSDEEEEEESSGGSGSGGSSSDEEETLLDGAAAFERRLSSDSIAAVPSLQSKKIATVAKRIGRKAERAEQSARKQLDRLRYKAFGDELVAGPGGNDPMRRQQQQRRRVPPAAAASTAARLRQQQQLRQRQLQRHKLGRYEDEDDVSPIRFKRPVLKRPDRSSISSAQRERGATAPRKRPRPDSISGSGSGTSPTTASTSASAALRRKRLLESQRELQARRQSAAKLRQQHSSAAAKTAKTAATTRRRPPLKPKQPSATSGIQFPSKPKARVILPRPMRKPVASTSSAPKSKPPAPARRSRLTKLSDRRKPPTPTAAAADGVANMSDDADADDDVQVIGADAAKEQQAGEEKTKSDKVAKNQNPEEPDTATFVLHQDGDDDADGAKPQVAVKLKVKPVEQPKQLPARHTGKYRMQIIDTGRMMLPGVTTPRGARAGAGGSTPKANGGSTPKADTKAAATLSANKSPSTATSSSSSGGGGVERTSTASVLQRLREKQDAASKKRKSPTLDQQQQQPPDSDARGPGPKRPRTTGADHPPPGPGSGPAAYHGGRGTAPTRGRGRGWDNNVPLRGSAWRGRVGPPPSMRGGAHRGGPGGLRGAPHGRGRGRGGPGGNVWYHDDGREPPRDFLPPNGPAGYGVGPPLRGRGGGPPFRGRGGHGGPFRGPPMPNNGRGGHDGHEFYDPRAALPPSKRPRDRPAVDLTSAGPVDEDGFAADTSSGANPQGAGSSTMPTPPLAPNGAATPPLPGIGETTTAPLVDKSDDPPPPKKAKKEKSLPPPPKKYLYQPNGAVWTGYVRDSRNRKVAVRFEQFGGVALKTLPLPPKVADLRVSGSVKERQVLSLLKDIALSSRKQAFFFELHPHGELSHEAYNAVVNDLVTTRRIPIVDLKKAELKLYLIPPNSPVMDKKVLKRQYLIDDIHNVLMCIAVLKGKLSSHLLLEQPPPPLPLATGAAPGVMGPAGTLAFPPPLGPPGGGGHGQVPVALQNIPMTGLANTAGFIAPPQGAPQQGAAAAGGLADPRGGGGFMPLPQNVMPLPQQVAMPPAPAASGAAAGFMSALSALTETLKKSGSSS